MLSSIKNIKNKKFQFSLKFHPKVNFNKYKLSKNMKLISELPSKKYFKNIIVSQSSSLVISFLENSVPFKLLKGGSTMNLLNDYKVKNLYLE